MEECRKETKRVGRETEGSPVLGLFFLFKAIVHPNCCFTHFLLTTFQSPSNELFWSFTDGKKTLNTSTVASQEKFQSNLT